LTSAETNARILVVDDEPGVVDYLVDLLRDEGYAVEGTVSPADALARQEGSGYDLVVADVEMPGMRGTDLLEAIHAGHPGRLVLLITAFGSIDLAVEAVRMGACDFVTKPFRGEVLLLAVARALRERQMRREIVRLRGSLAGAAASPDGLVARSRAMRRVVEVAERASRTAATVLLTGESGVGKGCVARFIHDQGPRAAGPFVQVNCAALPGPLVESELFGVRRGAYTDAREDRDGLFVRASGGTLFLDEVAELPIESQPKLLQALESGHVRPVGATREVPADARLVAATNRPLEEALRERRFRPDLYYRLDVIRIEVPPLRDRREDIEPLADVFLARAGSALGRQIVGISVPALRRMLAYDWPGNVRELANVVERAVALSDHDTLVPGDLRLGDDAKREDFLDIAARRWMPLADVERAYVRRVLESVDGNKAEAARILGIDRRTVYRKLDEPEPGPDAGEG